MKSKLADNGGCANKDIYQNLANMIENTVEVTVYMMPVGSIPVSVQFRLTSALV